MRKLLILLLFWSTATFAQDFEKEWKNVAKLEDLGLVKSADKAVAKIALKAERRQNQPELIRCFFHRAKYLQTLDRNAQSKIIAQLRELSVKAAAPENSVYNVIYFKCLRTYLARNRNLVNKIPVSGNAIGPDVLLWSHDDFISEMQRARTASMANQQLLKDTKLSRYEGIFDYVLTDRFARMTLFDWVISENIGFYNATSSQRIPDFRTKETLPFLTGSTAKFISADFDSVAVAENREMLKLLQLREKNLPSISNRIHRLDWLLENSETYRNALKDLAKEATDSIDRGNIGYALAQSYFNMSSSDLPQHKKIALAFADSIIATNHRSNAYINAVKLRDDILFKSLRMEIKQVRYPGENTRAFLSFRNIDSIGLKCYKVKAQSQFASEYEHRIDKQRRYADLIPVLSQTIALKNPGDHLDHTTEILLPQLPVGTYALSISAKDLDGKSTVEDSQVMVVTNLAYVMANSGDEIEFSIFSRDKGIPLPNAQLLHYGKGIRLDTDKNGKAHLPKIEPNIRYTTGWISKDGDSLALSQYSYRRAREAEKPQAKVQFYLDRAIYRPGQKVFFKGILVRKDSVSSGVMANAKLSVSVRDANRQQFFSTEVESNEFGSFSGEFTLPTQGLTGVFSIGATVIEHPLAQEAIWEDIENLQGGISFRVEEYKRPKFEVSMDEIKDNLLLGQDVAVRGKAKSLARSDVSGAKVTYKIDLERIEYASGESDWVSETVAQDSTFTDQKGNFSIKFHSSRHEDEDPEEKLPVYTYSIHVDVTDINGETRSAESSFKTGTHTLVLDFWVSELKKSKTNTIELQTVSLNGEFVPIKGKLEFSRIRKLRKNFKERIFSTPEIPGFSASEFARLFPNEVDETLLEVGADTRVIKTIAADSGLSKTLKADLATLEPGIYKVVFSAQDKFGNWISKSQRLELTDPDQKIDPSKLLTLTQLNEFPEKDGFAKFRVTSFVPDLNVHIEANDPKGQVFERQITLENHEAVVKIPIPKTSKIRLDVQADSFYDNAYESANHSVRLPFLQSKLEVETISYRNLIEPGSPQTWSFRIKAHDTEIESEILASMYDSSLDVFARSEWGSPEIMDYRYGYNARRDAHVNPSQYLGLSSVLQKSYGYPRPEQPRLMQFGFDPDPSQAKGANRLYKEQSARKAAQKRKDARLVYGKVTDVFGGLPNATVTVKNTDRHVLTDDNGYYEIQAEESETLVYSSEGFVEKDIAAKGYGRKDVELNYKDDNLGEVVVTSPLGIRKKMDAMTSSSQVVAYGSISDEPASVMQLMGRVSGLQINTDKNDNTRIVLRGNRSLPEGGQVLIVSDGKIISLAELQAMSPSDIISVDVLKGAQGAALYGQQGANGVVLVTSKKALAALDKVKTRTNLSETAFFFPHLRTDENGKAIFSFNSPESLTSWKLRVFAHNKKGVSGQLQQKVTTQKTLMLTPNFPRFLRERDSVVISVKISNMSPKVVAGNALLQFSDAATMKPVDIVKAGMKIRSFSLNPAGNASVEWKIAVPEGLSGLHYKVVAQSGDFSDGEESIIPVVSNRMLVTESKPLWVREHNTKEVALEHLASNKSQSLKHHLMTLEFTSNPAWLALQSLPYLMDYEHECAEQTFARFYASAVAASVIGSSPKIASVFEEWRQKGKGQLEQNQELKSILANETPWFSDALAESDKKKRLALLFDLEKLKSSQASVLNKLSQKQKASGAFGWFDGSGEDEYITRHIAAGIGHLLKLSVIQPGDETFGIGSKAIGYLDDCYMRRKAYAKETKRRFGGNYVDLHYLYARSFYLTDIKPKTALLEEAQHNLDQLLTERLELSLYQKAMAALVLNRFGKSKEAREIVDHLRETSASDETNGMYWVENTGSWHWYRAPIETQALLIEAFLEVSGDEKSVQAMKAWLIKNKQNSHWPTTKSTTEAIYALLLQGGDLLDMKDNIHFSLGNKKIASEKLSETHKEAGTGYIKINWKPQEITPDMATLKIDNKGELAGFGGFYWQYFEDLDKVTTSEKSSLSVSQEVLRKVDGKEKTEFRRIGADEKLKVGDLLTIRITVQATEDLEYVHLKSMRASCFEPVDVISGYQYSRGLGYYKSTKDVATHFFFGRLEQGSYQLEYEVRVNNSGDFSNGITTVQSMYAPEFSAHSNGLRLKVN